MRYIIAAAVGILYVAVAAWVVHSEGDAYRQALRRERTARIPDAPPDPIARSKTANPVRALTPKPPEPPAIVDLAKTKGVPLLPPPPSGLEASTTTASTAPTGTANPTAGGLPRPSATPDAPKEPDPAYIWANALDLAKLSVEQERRLGQELHRLVLTYNKKWENGALEQRVEDVARPLLKARSRSEIEYTFTLLDSEAVNAFSFPGGYVYVCRGLFNLLGEDEDYALEFVLGHEVAHVDLKHAIQRVAISNDEEKKRGLGTLPQFYLLVSFGYPDKLEYEADAWAFRRMMGDLDRSRHDSLAFLRKFERYAQDNGFPSGRQLPPPKATVPGELPPSLVENHFRAHTAARKRLAELKDFAATLRLPQK